MASSWEQLVTQGKELTKDRRSQLISRKYGNGISNHHPATLRSSLMYKQKHKSSTVKAFARRPVNRPTQDQIATHVSSHGENIGSIQSAQ